MRYLNIIAILWLLNSCGNPNPKTTNEETPEDTMTVEQISLSEPTLESKIATEQVITDKPAITEEPVTFDSIGRPSRTIIRNPKVDLNELFGAWTYDSDSPTAAFLIDKDKYYIADFDGDPVVPYILEGDSLTLFFEWGTQSSRISLPTPDLLIMSGKNSIKQYERFDNQHIVE